MKDNLLISDFTSLKELFKEPIYLIKSEFQEESQAASSFSSDMEEPLFNVKGDNLKNNVFIVFSKTDSLPDKDLDLYSKTISALKLSEKDLAFCIADFSMANQFETISQAFKNQKIVCFANVETYKENILTIRDTNTSKILPCPSLTELSEDKDLKVKWWNILKGFVNV